MPVKNLGALRASVVNASSASERHGRSRAQILAVKIYPLFGTSRPVGSPWPAPSILKIAFAPM
jgi:hypothetical protein